MEDSVYNTRRVVWADSNILWTYKLAGNVSDYDEENSLESYQY